jgi:hypothetical protein
LAALTASAASAASAVQERLVARGAVLELLCGAAKDKAWQGGCGGRGP